HSTRRRSRFPLQWLDGRVKRSESRTNWKQSRGSVTFRPTGWPKSMQRWTAKKTHSNGLRPLIAITPSGWDTSPSIRSLIATTLTSVFKSFCGESTCRELDYEIPMAVQLLHHSRMDGLANYQSFCRSQSFQN